MSLRQCSPRRKLFRSSLPAWQDRQDSEISFGDLPVKLMILVLSPPPSTCALPGPWQDSQPLALPFQLERVVRAACAVCERFAPVNQTTTANTDPSTSSALIDFASLTLEPPSSGEKARVIGRQAK